MKRTLIVIAIVALVVWVASWFRSPEAVSASAAKPWPGGVGSLDSVADRFPPQAPNAASLRLTTLAAALPKNDALDAFVTREIARGELAIGNPPQVPDVFAIRTLLLHEPIVWGRRRRGVGDQETTAMRAMQMTAARALVVSALARGHAGDAAAWDDLHALWLLARSLEGQPEMMLQTAAFTMTRWINAVAWKLPLPVPSWFNEVQQRDDVRRLLEAFQYQIAAYVGSGSRLFPTKMLANSVEHDRSIAASLAKETRCDVTPPMNEVGVDLTSLWHRAFRSRAEREATANALRIREGKTIESTSRCSDGTWSFDGTTLRFSHDIASVPPNRGMPLTLRMK